MDWASLTLALVGPTPPPAGGMASQTVELARLLGEDGAKVIVVSGNARCCPQWLERIPIVRTGIRLVAYCFRLWRAAGRAELVHVLANSGLSWHLIAAPAVWIARLRNRPVVVHYHGGLAEDFLGRSLQAVRATLRGASALVVPSGFLLDVFRRHGFDADIVPNVVDLSAFAATPRPTGKGRTVRVAVTRNLEPVYDVEAAVRALACLRSWGYDAHLEIAGTGSLEAKLRALVREEGLEPYVRLHGHLTKRQIAELLARSDVMLNPSRADNVPVSMLEAMASSRPVVSTRAGGIPYMVADGLTALLVGVGAHEAMARAIGRLVDEPELANRLAASGLAEAKRYHWPVLRDRWATIYNAVRAGSRVRAWISSDLQG
jgi:glycosyltransferase involved in cell wall biosynthesis